MAEKAKTIQFATSQVKTKAAGEDERRIVFVASSGLTDRHDERVDVESLRLPLRAGGSIRVEQIGSEGVEGIDIPLMLNHSFDVTDVIGSVRKAMYQNGELIFEAGISKREIAQEILTLIEEDHLGNAFSITMSDFDYDPEQALISNAEVIEVSVVFRGANKEARLLQLKSLLGGAMTKDAEPNEPVVEETQTETPVEEAEAEQKVEETEAQAEKPAEATAEEQGEAEEAEKAEEQTAEEAEPEKEEATEEPAQEETNKEETMEKSIATDEVVAKASAPVAKAQGNYLESKQALKDFKELILKSHRGTNEQIMKAWTESLKSKAISGDAILPARIEQIFFKTWTDKAEILNTFRALGVRSGAVYAMKATANGTAKAHTKGANKVNQEIEAIRRDLKGLCVYKKLPIDLQDLFDDETGELLAFRVEELAGRVAHAIVVGAIVGGYKDVNGRGLFSMVSDLKAVESDDFAGAVATSVEAVQNDTEIAKAIRTCGAVKGSRRILIVPAGWMTNARIALISMNYPVVDIADFVGADEIHELDELETTSGFDMIAYSRDSYVLGGERNASVRTDFDLTKNQDVMLVERYVCGSMTGYKNLAGYANGSEESESAS